MISSTFSKSLEYLTGNGLQKNISKYDLILANETVDRIP